MHRYPILQSGFVSFTENGLTKPGPAGPSFRQDILMKEYRTKADKYFYSKPVTEYYHKWRNNPSLIQQFEFREEIIKLFVQLFATSSLYKWMLFQNGKPSTSDLHTVFLIETLDYLMLDKARNIEIVQWSSLIEYSDKTDAIDVDLDKYFGRDTLGVSNGIKLPSGIHDIVSIWTSKPGGFEDMLITLYIIFGDREQKNDVVVNVNN